MHACHHIISSTRGVLEHLIDIFQQPLIVVRVKYILTTDDADAVIHRSSSSYNYSYPSTHGVASTLLGGVLNGERNFQKVFPFLVEQNQRISSEFNVIRF
jgi:hypothetical protein